ncbi:glucuronate isomerase [Ornithinimicrobium cryptoxanthini]|uniref:Uronate isomerase n=1 Tax=Ornithinimicrobium cryptoxanthini TaxID=2934161 RepID=A0ABY4YHC1_9MICO|nr:glucuronate isomerase [Ornithinimicrobium cryptoxanthini]USQ75921.1 glucuronate isomerase [Ornithinimicrobium cryptoxanthini]
MVTSALHPDRLLPADPGTRQIARELYGSVQGLPIISPHGHVPPEWLAQDTPFKDPTSLLLSPDHYIFRMLHAAGVPLAELGVGGAELDEAGARRAWAHLCEHWHLFLGTPVRYWLEDELVGIFGFTQTLSAKTADASYDRIAEVIAGDNFRPRALMDQFDISVLATTDDPCDDLRHHAALAADDTFDRRVLPTFRPDKYLEPGRTDFADLVARLAEVSGEDTGSYAGYVRALENRRRYFVEHGAVSSDHSHADVVTLTLEESEASRIYDGALAGTATEEETTALRRHMLVEMARMATEDGLVMTLHPGSYRNHHEPTLEAHGPDTGHDIPIQMEFTRGLQPLLSRFGTVEQFRLILFTLDETVFSREIAPLAGFYPSVYAGAPWWFLDAPEAIGRYRSAVTDTIGFYRTSGFIDDTRAFCSIPARHDMSRRLDSGFLARLVADHRLREEDAHQIATDLVTTIPSAAFNLSRGSAS